LQVADTSAGIFGGGLDESRQNKTWLPPIKKTPLISNLSKSTLTLPLGKLLWRPQRRDYEQNTPMTRMLGIEAQQVI
jgi:hypothetical protein